MFLSDDERDMLQEISSALGLDASSTLRTLLRDAMEDFDADEDAAEEKR